MEDFRQWVGILRNEVVIQLLSNSFHFSIISTPEIEYISMNGTNGLVHFHLVPMQDTFEGRTILASCATFTPPGPVPVGRSVGFYLNAETNRLRKILFYIFNENKVFESAF